MVYSGTHGLVRRAKLLERCGGVDRVVPRHLEPWRVIGTEASSLLVIFTPVGVVPLVELGIDLEALLRRRVGDQLDDDPV